MAQYRELAAFSQFGSDLDKATQDQLNRGARLVELLKQGQYQPQPVEKQILIIFAGVSGLLDSVPVNEVVRYERELLEYFDLKHEALLKEIKTKKQLDQDLKEKITKIIKEFNESFK